MEIKSRGKAKVVQALAFDGDTMYVQYGYLKNQRIEVFKLKNGEWKYEKGKDFGNKLGHANGLTVCGHNLYSVRGHSRKVVIINKHSLDIIQTRVAPTSTCGAIGFNGEEFCFSEGKYLCFGNFDKLRKRIEKKKPYKYQQDLCYWKDYVFNCVSVNKTKNYIYIYKNDKLLKILKNVHNGFELEGCAVNDEGELYVLLNRRHKTNDKIVKVKWK